MAMRFNPGAISLSNSSILAVIPDVRRQMI
jgi:hypothetical protein